MTPRVLKVLRNSSLMVFFIWDRTESLYAIDIPPTVNINEAYKVLEQGEADGVWEFEEGYYHKEV
jgi:hypothetical protein